MKVVNNLHVGWSGKDKVVVWISNGKSLADFWGSTVSVYRDEIKKLIAALEKLQGEKK